MIMMLESPVTDRLWVCLPPYHTTETHGEALRSRAVRYLGFESRHTDQCVGGVLKKFCFKQKVVAGLLIKS